jgi:hypothetical protein
MAITGAPSLHKQLLFLPTVLGTLVFVMAGLDIGGVMYFVVSFVLLFVTAVPFQFGYTSLFPEEPRRLREAKVSSSMLLLASQIALWIMLFVIVNYWRSQHGT